MKNLKSLSWLNSTLNVILVALVSRFSVLV